jgi:proteasomal ATPase-associated factor 1
VSASSRTGDIKVFDPISAQSVIDLSGHRGGTHSCKFFPSGKLVLSGGSDLRLKIWTVAEGALAAEFSGHSGGITAVAVVGRGRSVLSCSRDGCAKLWNSGSQQCIQTFNTDPSESAGVANQCKVFGQGISVLLIKVDSEVTLKLLVLFQFQKTTMPPPFYAPSRVVL